MLTTGDARCWSFSEGEISSLILAGDIRMCQSKFKGVFQSRNGLQEHLPVWIGAVKNQSVFSQRIRLFPFLLIPFSELKSDTGQTLIEEISAPQLSNSEPGAPEMAEPCVEASSAEEIYTNKHHTLCHRDCQHYFSVLFIPVLLCPFLHCPSLTSKNKTFLLVQQPKIKNNRKTTIGP